MTRRKKLMMSILATTVAVGAVASLGWARFGSLRAALLYTGGIQIIAEPDTQSVGDLSPKERGRARFRLSNLSGKTISVYGSTASCACVVVDDLPKPIPAGGREEFVIAYRAGDRPGEVKQSIVLLTDSAISPRVSLTISGMVVDGSQREGPQAK